MNGNSVRILAECKHCFKQARKMSSPVELNSCSVLVQNVNYFKKEVHEIVCGHLGRVGSNFPLPYTKSMVMGRRTRSLMVSGPELNLKVAVLGQ